VPDGLIEFIVCLDRQDRAKDLLLHQGEVIGRVKHDRHRQLTTRVGVDLAALLERSHVAATRLGVLN